MDKTRTGTEETRPLDVILEPIRFQYELTLSLGREDDHFLFASMGRYQFNGLLKKGKTRPSWIC